MSVFTYTFTKELDIRFLSDLHQTLTQQQGLPSNFYINLEAQLEIIFYETLNVDQENILNDLINNYIPPQYSQTFYSSETMDISNPIVTSPTYFTSGVHFWIPKPSSDIVLDYVSIITSCSGTYKLRLYDSISNVQLAETNELSNDLISNIKLTDMSIPSTNTLIELQALTSKTCTIKACIFVFVRRESFIM